MSAETGATDPQVIDARGHSAATLYEAAKAERRHRAQAAAAGADLAEPDIAVSTAIRTAWVGAAVAGPAFTVQGASGDNLALHRAVGAAAAGHVVVADVGGGAFGHWGEVLAVAAQARGIAGLVVDGGVRDIDQMCRLGFPVFSRSNSVRGTTKLFAGELGVDIVLGGVPVSTGDLVVGDTDGLVIVPRSHVSAVLDYADRRAAEERAIMEALRVGATTLELYKLDGRPRDGTA
ncbi:MAG: RraA family protein [Acidimicrobiales bacterium]